MSTDGKDRPAKSLPNLGSLPANPPTTSTGKVAWAWPQISAALQAGWRMHDVWSALRADGFDIPYKQFRVYVSRLRRRFAQAPASVVVARPSTETAPATLDTSAKPPAPTAIDPYAGIREQRKLKQQGGFEYDPFSTDKDLLK
jgi:hypothetical protein